MKQLIVCIVGQSGSGKTTSSMLLSDLFGWTPVVSYTTRKMRPGEKNGLDHWFVKKKDVPSKQEMFAYTQFAGNEYWTTYDQFSILFPVVYVIDEKGLLELQERKDIPFDFELATIYIKRNDLSNISEERKQRDNERLLFPEWWYDYVIHNNGTVDELKECLYSIGLQITSKHQ